MESSNGSGVRNISGSMDGHAMEMDLGDGSTDRPVHVEGTITAWRAWYVEYTPSTGRFNLKSVVQRTQWFPGEAIHTQYTMADVRKDRRDGDDRYRGGGHIRGFHASKDLRPLMHDYVGGVVGQVELWGLVTTHTLGYRAEYAQVQSITMGICRECRKADVLKDMEFVPMNDYRGMNAETCDEAIEMVVRHTNCQKRMAPISGDLMSMQWTPVL